MEKQKEQIDYLKLAEEIARKYHKGQKRLDGSDYITHLQGVVKLIREGMTGLKIVAWLHDILEDTPMTKEKLLDFGFDKGLIKSVVILTRKEDEDYLDYVLRCYKDEIAIEVKIADLTNNLSTIRKGSLKDKYRLTRFILMQKRGLNSSHA